MCTYAATSSRKLIPTALLAVALGGCTLVMEGTTQQVAFTSEPPGAEVRVAGRTATTPATLTLPKEACQAVFVRPGYYEETRDLALVTSDWFYASLVLGVVASIVDIATGAWKQFETASFHVVLRERTEVEERPLRVESSPTGAEVIIDSSSRGRTPLDLKLPWKSKEIEKKVELRLDRHEPKTVAVERDQRTAAATLVPIAVKVMVTIASKPEGANIFIDGEAAGVTPQTRELAWLPSSPPRSVRIVREGYRGEEERLTPDRKEIRVTLAELVREEPLALAISPRGAVVEIDGVELGAVTGPVMLKWSVSLQQHEARIRHPGCVERVVKVTPATKKLEVVLAPAIVTIP